MEKSFMMLFHTDGKRLKSHFTTFSVLVFHLHLTHFCKGEFQLIGSSLPIVATLGDDIILPCLMRPAEDASGLTLEWTRPDLSPRFVYVWRSGQELEGKKHKFFEGRTSLFIDELRLGNISLKLSKVKLTDEGQYRCFIPALGRQSSIQLVVGSNAVSTPVITLTGIDEATSGVVLQCESTGWYPEPEVFWLDAEGNLLSAGPTETVRGPDDLYTVSSRVTVEKRHSNSFTCRVQQNSTNHTRETLIHVPDVFFEVQLNFSTITTGLAVGLAVCILVILLLVFFVWRQNKTKTKRSHRDETNKRVKKKCLKSNKTEDQFVTEEERARQPLMTHETVQMKVFNEGNDKNIRPEIQEGQEVQKEQQRREETENRVKTLKEELGTKKTEVKKKQADLQLLHEEKQRKEENLQRLKEHLENKNTELETIMASLTQFWMISLNPKKDEELKKKQEVEKEVETLKKELETEETELDTKIKEFDDKLPEVQQFKGEIQMMESTLQTLIEELDSKNLELERTGVSTVLSSSSSWPLVSRQKFQAELQKFQEEHQKREEAENQVRILEEKLEKKTRELEGNQVDTIMQLLQEKQKRQKAQREVDALKNQSQSKINEVDSLRTRVKKLSEENLKLENKKKEYEEKAQAGNTTWKRTNEELKEAKAQVKNMKEEISQLRTQYDNLLWNVKEKEKKAEKDLMTKNTEWEKKLQEEKTKRETADEEVEKLKKELKTKRGACKCEAAVHNTSSPSQRSTTGPVIEVDPRGKYVRLKNASKEDQHLEGWMLQVLVNNKNIMYTFEKSFKISPGKILTLWDPNHGIHYPPTDLIWKDLHSLSSGDQLQVILFNNTRETKLTQSTCIER